MGHNYEYDQFRRLALSIDEGINIIACIIVYIKIPNHKNISPKQVKNMIKKHNDCTFCIFLQELWLSKFKQQLNNESIFTASISYWKLKKN